MYVDAYPDTTLTGKSRTSWLNNSEYILYVAIKQRNSELYESNKVVPVKISLDHSKSVNIVPGMNVTVRIHK